MTLLIFYLFLALAVSFLCSVMEAVLLSTPVTFLRVKKDEGYKSAQIFLKIKENIDRPLSAILSLNTIAHTIGAAGVGAQAAKLFGEVYFGIISAILTVLILIFSEIIPKTIGARYYRKLALFTAKMIRVVIILMYPLVILAEFITRLISRNQAVHTVSREEVSAMAKIGLSEGVFEEKENKIIQNLLRLKFIKAESIMTPRVVVSLANENMLMKDFVSNKDFLHYSRIPLFHESKDNVTGYIFRQQVFECMAEGKSNEQLMSIRRPIVTVNNSQYIYNVWETLLEKKEHIALVVDEYGGMDGIVTMEDIIETILGLEIVDEKDQFVDMQRYARERWKARRAKYNLLD